MTPEPNRQAAGGITGGRIEYRVEYTRVGAETTISPPAEPQPLSDFVAQVQQILAEPSR